MGAAGRRLAVACMARCSLQCMAGSRPLRLAHILVAARPEARPFQGVQTNVTVVLCHPDASLLPLTRVAASGCSSAACDARTRVPLRRVCCALRQSSRSISTRAGDAVSRSQFPTYCAAARACSGLPHQRTQQAAATGWKNLLTPMNPETNQCQTQVLNGTDMCPQSRHAMGSDAGTRTGRPQKAYKVRRSAFNCFNCWISIVLKPSTAAQTSRSDRTIWPWRTGAAAAAPLAATGPRSPVAAPSRRFGRHLSSRQAPCGGGALRHRAHLLALHALHAHSQQHGAHHACRHAPNLRRSRRQRQRRGHGPAAAPAGASGLV